VTPAQRDCVFSPLSRCWSPSGHSARFFTSADTAEAEPGRGSAACRRSCQYVAPLRRLKCLMRFSCAAGSAAASLHAFAASFAALELERELLRSAWPMMASAVRVQLR
jgi:hypothetical protein